MIRSRPSCRTLRLFALPALSLALLGCPQGQSQSPPPAPEPAQPVAPLVKKPEIADWCPEHGVPESICSRCNEALVAGFKAKGDWCEEHSVADSQCFTCKPELKEEFLKKKPN